ncbi:MAG: hypothetical protein M0Z94_08160 [Dehalococcoidales bacterium]|nr:hypothetical protein [Dehalococcoidales bacterium]
MAERNYRQGITRRGFLRSALALTAALPLLGTPALALARQVPAPAAPGIADEFAAFYQAKGGEEIFGLPLTGAVGEDGHTAQYFTRARLESWPENPPTYRVQVGLLGVLLGKVQPPITANVAPTDPARRYFPQTGHVVAFAFKDFWETRGGLEIFGYPVSEQLVEDGTVVQYFQRARMEWQPGNPAGKQVVLGNLGAEYLGLGAAPVATASPVIQPSPVRSGQWLVFHTAPGGDLYAVHPDGSGLARLGTGMTPSWSADGSKIVYAQWDYPWGVYTMDADGANPRQVAITSYPYEVKMSQSPVESPDGRYIAYGEKYRDWRKVRPYIDDKGQLVTEELQDLWRVGVVVVATGQVHLVAQADFAADPTWGPDGRLIFEGRDGLYVLNEIETNRQIAKVAGTDSRFSTPSWSPDGQRLVFSWRQHDHWEIGMIGVDGSGFQILTSSRPFVTPANNVSPAWSPDGGSVVFASDRNGKWELFTMRADGSEQRPVDLGGLELTYEFARERMVAW